METTKFPIVNPHAAGIDIGSQKIFVSVDGATVENFKTFTEDYKQCIAYLKEHNIKMVAMEATGVYWIAFHAMLEQSGIEVCLVNPKEVKQVKGRKTDVKDCQWIQRLFSAGLIRQSYVPQGNLKELRLLVREREDIIQMGSTYVNKMQKALELMNIKLPEVIAQIQGVSGLKMIEAILQGERNPAKLLALCDARIISTKSKDVLAALEGNYNKSYLFMLKMNLQMWKHHQNELVHIDKEIETLLNEMNSHLPTINDSTPIKPIRFHKPDIEDLHQKLMNLFGVNLTTLCGLNDYSLLRLIGETGNDLSRFPTVKHFTGWCQLTPRLHNSGMKNKTIRIRSKNPSGQIFRDVARSLLNSKNSAIGAFMRRIRSKKGTAVAIKAGARKLASAYYNAITKGIAYVEKGINDYNKILKERELKLLEKLAVKHNLILSKN